MPGKPGMRRGSVIVIAVWTIAVCALAASAVQLFAFRQAAYGREALHRVQARWAARAGVESTISEMSYLNQYPDPDDAWALVRGMEAVWWGDVLNASWTIQHHAAGTNYRGPMDEHSKLNINGMDPTMFDMLDDITPDVAAAIVDWLDADDNALLLGAERDWYLSNSSIEPRNGPMRSIVELELVAGVWPDVVRGEDWNMNNRLDPYENDGNRSLPDDEPDDELDAGWSTKLTAISRADGATGSGKERIYLRRAEPEEIMERLGLDEIQAQALIDYGSRTGSTLEGLITTPLGPQTPEARQPQQQSTMPGRRQAGQEDEGEEKEEGQPKPEPLDDDQLAEIFAEATMYPLYMRRPGRMNINTVTEELLRDVFEWLGTSEAVTDEVIYMRNSRTEGIPSILDLYEIPDIEPELLQKIAGLFGTTSNVYTITSRGRASGSDLEIEIIAVVDRSTVPVTILEYREQ